MKKRKGVVFMKHRVKYTHMQCMYKYLFASKCKVMKSTNFSVE